jgi:acetyltransferase
MPREPGRESGTAHSAKEAAPSAPWVPVLHGFRVYAILGVVALHLFGLSGALSPGSGFALIAWGTLGNVLDVFFILSGFGLFLPVVARGELGDLRLYARKRAARLLPAYWVTLAILLVLMAIALPWLASGYPSPEEVAVQFSTLQMPVRLLDASLPVGFGVDGPLWMISVIAGFYVLVALLARPYLRHPVAGLALAAAITLGWKLAAVHLTGFFGAIEGGHTPAWIVKLIVVDQLPGWAFSFALGMTCAWAYVHLALPRPREQLERLALWVAPFALVAFGVCAYFYGSDAAQASGASAGNLARTSPFLGLAFTTSRAAVMGVIVLGPAVLSRPFANRAISRVAELSYGLYLMHLVVGIYLGGMILGLPRDGSVGATALWFAVVLPPTFAYAYLSVRFVERPALAWARRPRSVPKSAPHVGPVPPEEPVAGAVAGHRGAQA